MNVIFHIVAISAFKRNWEQLTFYSQLPGPETKHVHFCSGTAFYREGCI